MAKQVNFTNRQGVIFPISYWRVTRVTIDLDNKAINVTITGHKDNNARQSDLQIIGRKSFNITDLDDFNTLMGLVISKVRNPIELGYAIANRDDFFNSGDDV